MVVTTTTLYSASRTALKDLLNSNVIDPKTNQKNSRRRWIYREMPDTTSRDFAGYPFIVIPSAEYADDIQTVDQNLSDGQFDFEIQILAEFNDVNARVDTLSDQITSLFRLRSHQSTLASKNLHEPTVTSSPFNNQTEDGKLLSGRIINVQFNSTIEDNS